MEKRTKLEKLEIAKGRIDDAEELLKTALLDIKSAPRAEKVTVSEALRAAFDNLKIAKSVVLELAELVAEEED
jgi:hypothetical protein